MKNSLKILINGGMGYAYGYAYAWSIDYGRSMGIVKF
jgi:hypothetical protein